MAYTNSLDFLTTFYGKANPHGNLAWTVAKTIEWSFKLHGILTELIRAWLQLLVADVVTRALTEELLCEDPWNIYTEIGMKKQPLL